MAFRRPRTRRPRKPRYNRKPRKPRYNRRPRYHRKPRRPRYNKRYTRNRMPQFKMNHGKGTIIIKHTEFVQSLFSSTNGTFSAVNIPLNPGNNMFSFISQLASGFEKYRFLKLAVVYKSLSGQLISSTSTALGAVGIATSYNSAQFLANPWTSKFQTENQEGSVSGSPNKHLVHHVKVRDGANPLKTLYVNSTNTIPFGSDSRFYDVGVAQVFSQGTQNNALVELGEIYISYVLELSCPRIWTNQLANSSLTSLYILPTTGMSKTNIFGNAPYPNSNNAQAVTLSNDGGNNSLISFPPNIVTGDYLICYSVNVPQQNTGLYVPGIFGTNVGGLSIFSNTVVNGSTATGFLMNGGAQPGVAVGSTLGQLSFAHAVKITGPNATIAYDCHNCWPNFTAPSNTSGTLLITQINGQINSVY